MYFVIYGLIYTVTSDDGSHKSIYLTVFTIGTMSYFVSNLCVCLFVCLCVCPLVSVCDVSFQVDDFSVLVQWKRVAAASGGPVIAYLIQRCRADHELWESAAYIMCCYGDGSPSSNVALLTSDNLREDVLSWTVRGLLPLVSYHFRVKPIFRDRAGQVMLL